MNYTIGFPSKVRLLLNELNFTESEILRTGLFLDLINHLTYQDEIAHLHSNKIRAEIGTSFASYLPLKLNNADIVGIDNSYQADNYTKSYWLYDEFLANSICEFDTIDVEHYKTVQFLNERRKKERKLFRRLGIEHMTSNYYDLDIDLEKVEKYIPFKKPEAYSKRKHIALSSALRVHHQNITSIIAKNDRLFNPLTQLMQDYRSFLFSRSTGRSDFYEIDMANCQPNLFSIFLQKEHRDILNKPDVKIWINESRKGTLYDYIASELKKERGDIKEWFMKAYLYTQNHRKYLKFKKNKTDEEIKWLAFSENMERLFPTITKTLLAIKKQMGKSVFAIMLQKKEAQYMIMNVLPATRKFGTIFTVHDALFCFPEYIEPILELMQRKARKAFGQEIPLKIEKVEMKKGYISNL